MPLIKPIHIKFFPAELPQPVGKMVEKPSPVLETPFENGTIQTRNKFTSGGKYFEYEWRDLSPDMVLVLERFCQKIDAHAITGWEDPEHEGEYCLIARLDDDLFVKTASYAGYNDCRVKLKIYLHGPCPEEK